MVHLKMSKNTIKGYLFAVLSAVIYGTMPLMAKYIYADGVTPATLVFLRNFFATVPLGVLAYSERGTLKIKARLLPKVSLISLLGCFATPVLLFSSYRYIPSGTATVFHFVYPAFVVLGGILFSGEKPKAKSLLCVAMCVGGVALFYSPGEALNLTGSLLALASAVTFSAYVICLSRFAINDMSGFTFAFYVALISSIASFIFCICTGELILPSSIGILILCVIFSLLVTVGAVVLFQQSTFLIGGERASILSTLEPITGVILGIIVFGESFTLPVVIGTVMVISAGVLRVAFDTKKPKAK